LQVVLSLDEHNVPQLINIMTDLNSNKTPSMPSDREIAKRGRDLYDRSIRSQVETRDNIGKIISIDIKTGNYEIDDNLLAASDLLQSQFPDPIIWAERIGFNAVYAVGGTLTKVDLS
jgi:hypothetical protein